MSSLKLSAVAVMALLSASTLHADPQAIPVASLGREYQLIGKLHAPLGAPVEIVAVAMTEDKTKTGEPYLQIQRINGVATQEDIRITAQPFFGKWGEKGEPYLSLNLPEFEPGKTYEMKGYETGSFGGTPDTVWKDVKLSIQSPFSYRFRTEFIVTTAKIVASVHFQPADFEGRWAQLEGVARSKNGQALMEGDDWQVIVDAKAAWPKDIEGKTIETYGFCRFETSNRKTVSLLESHWRLVRLEDQVGHAVELRGEPHHREHTWYLSYRGQDLYIDGVESLPGWTDKNYGRPVVIRGILEKAMLPDVDQIGRKVIRDLKEYYVIRKPSWEAIPSLSGPERLSGEPRSPKD